MILRRGLLALGLIFVCGGAWAQRLPGGVRPEHYSLTITPDLAAARFTGSETIEVTLAAPASEITLNAAEIEFGAVKAYVGRAGGQEQQQIPFGNDKQKGKANTEILSGAQNDKQEQNAHAGVPSLAPLGRDDGSGGVAAQTATVTLDEAKEQATLHFAQPLPAGPVRLEIAYKGTINSRLRGFYLSKTKTRSYGVTQFESTDARRAFPCFDEPALKATFDVALVVDAGDMAISNMKMVRDTRGPGVGKHTVAFATTPKMSTYLVAWLVGDFKCTEGKEDGVPIRACATPDKVLMTKFSLDAAKWTLHYYDKYFGIKYPLKKLDLVAIPDFEAGAMENFGCITFRETEMLVDAKYGTREAKKEVAETVMHEMAHQWFGDLVTPRWWDDLWLNEGFATWMERKAGAAWQPKWGYDTDAAVEMNHTMDEDAGKTTRAIRTRAETPAEIEELFDDIAYGKAGAVVGMVENWVGEETFRRGVQAYLGAHAYGNAGAEDFWNAQVKVSGLPVDTVMRSFVDQPGVPEVSLGKPVAGATGVPVRQREFLISKPDTEDEPRGIERWTLPVCLKGDGCTVVSSEDETLAAPASGFLYANAGDKGYYRTRYTADELKAIVASAETGLTVPERIGLLGDEWALMRGGQGTVGAFLDLALAVKQDANATVLESALGKVRVIQAKIATEDDRERLDAVVRREFDPVYAALGGAQKHESQEHVELRETLFGELGEAKDAKVLAEAESLAKQLFSGEKATDPMMADAAVALASQTGDAAMYEKLMKLSRDAVDPDVKEAALNALTRFENPALVGRTLEYAVSDAVRSQDSWTLIALLLERRPTQEQAWAFVKEHWAAVAKKATPSSGAHIVEAAGTFCTVERRDDVAAFFAAHPVENSARTLAKTIDSINDCIRLRAVQEPELRRWLEEHGGS